MGWQADRVAIELALETVTGERLHRLGYHAGGGGGCEIEGAQHALAGMLAHEGIQIDPTKMVHNESLRLTSKLGLNSFWGKFGQRPDLERTEFFDVSCHG